jgi:ribosome maturation factor RimP
MPVFYFLHGFAAGPRKQAHHRREWKVSRPPSSPESRREPTRAVPSIEAHVLGVARPLADSLCDDIGIELVHLEYLRDRGGRIMRLYIDKPGGVTLEDCAEVSRELSDLLDVRLPELGPYHLEVSSPGPNRPLSRPADFDRFRGQRVKIRTRAPIDGRRNFSGTLDGMADGAVRVNMGRGTVAIALEAISKAHLTDH